MMIQPPETKNDDSAGMVHVKGSVWVEAYWETLPLEDESEQYSPWVPELASIQCALPEYRYIQKSYLVVHVIDPFLVGQLLLVGMRVGDVDVDDGCYYYNYGADWDHDP
jgi:hypothetical protein